MTSSATTNGHVIKTRALTKRYGELRAVDGVNLEVRAGDVYGFLGANGSGKTTTVRMLLGLVLPTSGEAEVLSLDALPLISGERRGDPFEGKLANARLLLLVEGSKRLSRTMNPNDVLQTLARPAALGVTHDRIEALASAAGN